MRHLEDSVGSGFELLWLVFRTARLSVGPTNRRSGLLDARPPLCCSSSRETKDLLGSPSASSRNFPQKFYGNSEGRASAAHQGHPSQRRPIVKETIQKGPKTKIGHQNYEKISGSVCSDGPERWVLRRLFGNLGGGPSKTGGQESTPAWNPTPFRSCLGPPVTLAEG